MLIATIPPVRTVFDVITDFLASSPTPEAIHSNLSIA